MATTRQSPPMPANTGPVPASRAIAPATGPNIAPAMATPTRSRSPPSPPGGCRRHEPGERGRPRAGTREALCEASRVEEDDRVSVPEHDRARRDQAQRRDRRRLDETGREEPAGNTADEDADGIRGGEEAGACLGEVEAVCVVGRSGVNAAKKSVSTNTIAPARTRTRRTRDSAVQLQRVLAPRPASVSDRQVAARAGPRPGASRQRLAARK